MSDRQIKLNIVFEAIDKAGSKLTAIQKTAMDAGKQLQNTRTELRKLNDTDFELNSFIKLKKELGENSAKLAEAQAKVRKLAREIKEAEKPTRAMTKAFEEAKKEAAALGDRVEKGGVSLQRMRDRLKDAGVNTRNLVSDQKELKDKIEAATKAVKKQEEEYRSLKKYEKTPASIPEKNTPTGPSQTGTVPAKAGPGSVTDKAVKAGLIWAAIREVTDFFLAPNIADARAEDQLTQIGIKADLTRERLAAIREEISKMAPELRIGTEELRGGLDFLAASGLHPDAALKMMQPLGKAAHAYKTDMREISQATNSAISNLKIDLGPNDMNRTRVTGRLTDMMSVAGKEGNFEFADMSRHFPTLTARLASLGETGPDAAGKLAAALQIAWKATGNADQAANNIYNLL